MNIKSDKAQKIAHNLEIVQQYHEAGYNLIPLTCDGSKGPKIKAWNRYANEPFAPDRFAYWFGDASRQSGIGLMCGRTSGGLEVLDFDWPPAFMPWAKAVCREFPGLLQPLPIIATPDNGRHVYWRSPIIEPSQVLAKDEAGKLLIETIAQGESIIAVGSPPWVHPARKPYRQLSGKLLGLRTITAEQRSFMLDEARRFNRYFKPASPPRKPANDSSEWLKAFGIEREICERPGDRFNGEASWEQVLVDWTKVRESNGITYWQKPGSAGLEHHATTGHHGRDTLYVFSTAIDGLEAGQAYSKFAVYAALHHGGDYSEAARQLAAKYSNHKRGNND